MSERIRAACEALAPLVEPAPNPPATDEQIAKLESEYGRALPADYKAFLKLHDGWMGVHWAVDDLFTAGGDGDLQDREVATELFHDQADFDEWVLQVRDATLVVGCGNDAQLVSVPEQGFVLYSQGEKEEEVPSFAAFLEWCVTEAQVGE